jgi:co-chaperonin GroES (HSP10)
MFLNDYGLEKAKSLKEGDMVILPPIGPVKIEEEGQEYWSCQESQVLAIIE